MYQSHSWITECGRAGERVANHLEISEFRDWFSCLWWSETPPSFGFQIMAFWHTVCVGRQVCPKVSVGLDYLQAYTASRVEHVYTHDVQKVKIRRQ